MQSGGVKNILSATYSDVISLRDPEVVTSRGVAGGARSHVCAGEACACVCSSLEGRRSSDVPG